MYRRSQSPEMMQTSPVSSTFHGLAYGAPNPASPQQAGFVTRRTSMFTPQQQQQIAMGHGHMQQQPMPQQRPLVPRQTSQQVTSPTFLFGNNAPPPATSRQDSYTSPLVRATPPPPKPSTPIGLFPVRKPSMSMTTNEAANTSNAVVDVRPQTIGTPANSKLAQAQHKGVTWSPVLVQEMSTPATKHADTVRGPPLRSSNARHTSAANAATNSSHTSTPDNTWLMVVGFNVDEQRDEVVAALQQFGPVSQIAVECASSNWMSVRFVRAESTALALERQVLHLSPTQIVTIVKATSPPTARARGGNLNASVTAGKENNTTLDEMNMSSAFASPSIRRLTAKYEDGSMNDSMNDSRAELNSSVIGKAFSYMFG